MSAADGCERHGVAPCPDCELGDHGRGRDVAYVIDVYTREDGAQVTVYAGIGRPPGATEWRRDGARPRKDRRDERKPTERDGLDRVAGLPNGLHAADRRALLGLRAERPQQLDRDRNRVRGRLTDEERAALQRLAREL